MTQDVKSVRDVRSKVWMWSKKSVDAEVYTHRLGWVSHDWFDIRPDTCAAVVCLHSVCVGGAWQVSVLCLYRYYSRKCWESCVFGVCTLVLCTEWRFYASVFSVQVYYFLLWARVCVQVLRVCARRTDDVSLLRCCESWMQVLYLCCRNRCYNHILSICVVWTKVLIDCKDIWSSWCGYKCSREFIEVVWL